MVPARVLCDICGKVYSRKWNMLQHIERMHQGKNFDRKSSIDSSKKRLKSCTLQPKPIDGFVRVKMYKCGHCEKRFDEKNVLMEHVLVVHGKPTIKERSMLVVSSYQTIPYDGNSNVMIATTNCVIDNNIIADVCKFRRNRK